MIFSSDVSLRRYVRERKVYLEQGTVVRGNVERNRFCVRETVKKPGSLGLQCENADAASMELGNALDNGQSKAGALRFPTGILATLFHGQKR